MHVEISNHGKAFAKWCFKRPRCSFRLTIPALSKVKTCLGRPRIRVYDLFINQRYAECHSIDTMSNGSMSPDLGERWHHEHPVRGLELVRERKRGGRDCGNTSPCCGERSGTVARRWNVGCRFAMSKKNNPLVENFRQ